MNPKPTVGFALTLCICLSFRALLLVCAIACLPVFRTSISCGDLHVIAVMSIARQDEDEKFYCTATREGIVRRLSAVCLSVR